MSEFFNSEIVQEELDEIRRMQEEIYGQVMNIDTLTSEERHDHIEDLCELLEKQRIMYTRISLSDDPQALELKNQMQQSVKMLGFPEGTDMNVLFSGMRKTIEALRQHID
jgi:vacuolar-type H+-ATPase subunit E/Vma4